MGIRIILFFLATSTTACADIDKFNLYYSEILSRYWHSSQEINGISTTVLDYASIKNNISAKISLLDKAAQAMEDINIEGFGNEKEEKAFWINAYNFAAIKLVVDYYPVDSIRSLRISIMKYPWSKGAITIGRRSFSLKEIEKDILLEKFNDPRIVFAVSCAAVSCPDRINVPFSGEILDQQIDDMIFNFFKNQSKGMRYDKAQNLLVLSSILKKDIELLGNSEEGVIDFVSQYLSADLSREIRRKPIRIDYFVHDWTLNDLSQVRVSRQQ